MEAVGSFYLQFLFHARLSIVLLNYSRNVGNKAKPEKYEKSGSHRDARYFRKIYRKSKSTISNPDISIKFSPSKNDKKEGMKSATWSV